MQKRDKRMHKKWTNQKKT